MARINSHPEKWNVKKCADQSGFQRCHCHHRWCHKFCWIFPIYFFYWWCSQFIRFVRSLPYYCVLRFSVFFSLTKNGWQLWWFFCAFFVHGRRTPHYTYNRFISVLMADMLVKYVWWLCLHIHNVVYIEFQEDDDGNGDIFTVITLSIIESIWISRAFRWNYMIYRAKKNWWKFVPAMKMQKFSCTKKVKIKCPMKIRAIMIYRTCKNGIFNDSKSESHSNILVILW